MLLGGTFSEGAAQNIASFPPPWPRRQQARDCQLAVTPGVGELGLERGDQLGCIHPDGTCSGEFRLRPRQFSPLNSPDEAPA